jgi:hypothetical protein
MFTLGFLYMRGTWETLSVTYGSRMDALEDAYARAASLQGNNRGIIGVLVLENTSKDVALLRKCYPVEF